MREQLLNFLAPREEKFVFAGAELVVREISESSDTTGFVNGQDSFYKFIVRCVFEADGSPAFTDADIPQLKLASKVKLRELAEVVGRVNGWSTDNEIKNSAAGPSAG